MKRISKPVDEKYLRSSPAVRTALQRQHISRERIDYGFEKARRMGYKAVIVAGNPVNWRARDFEMCTLIAAIGIGIGNTSHTQRSRQE